MKRIRKGHMISAGLFLLFVIYTFLVKMIDVAAIGPEQSEVGFATLNQAVFEALGTNMTWYHITDWMGKIAILTAAAFAVLGVIQMIKRKSVLKVDTDILLLGVHYILVVIFYVFFELAVINYRPMILEEGLEASYPSSHTMLVLCIMIPAMLQCKQRIQNGILREAAELFCAGIALVTVIGRLICGVHWFTDILGGILLSISLIALYISNVRAAKAKKGRK